MTYAMLPPFKSMPPWFIHCYVPAFRAWPQWLRPWRTGIPLAIAVALLLVLSPLPAARAHTHIKAWNMWAPDLATARGHQLFQTIQQDLQHSLKEPVHIQWFAQQPDIQTPSPRPLPQVFFLYSGSYYGSPQSNPRHLQNLEPLMVFTEMPWCLFAKKSFHLPETHNLPSALAQLPQPVHIGINAQSNSSVLWARALVRRNGEGQYKGLTLNVTAFDASQPLEQIFDNGNELVMAHCWRALNLPASAQLIAQSRKASAPYVPQVPTFVQLKLPPLQPAWLTAFSEKQLPLADKQRLIAALEHAAQSAEVQRPFNQMGLLPLHMNHEQSHAYMQTYLRTWQSVSNLLQWDDSQLPPSPNTP